MMDTNLVFIIKLVIALVTEHIIGDIILVVCSQIGDQLVD